jgi:hypothetical protein
MYLVMLLFNIAEERPVDSYPPVEGVVRILCVRAMKLDGGTLLGSTDECLTRWHPKIVVTLDCRVDRFGDWRVTKMSLRLKRPGESFFPLPTPRP